ncbi:sensor histidine kinase [Phormidium sp. FACHB-592]|uniref:ATP-binding protein n=1 Tax=Stenomitos frigidus AS-A4 TaxID=2933935 RepID=A0ABV0KU10_9CYAN|nr:ATP-binding protein [Phormidium sp. FACHB-592]MBD2073923.1 sensor histidine kinase [Phormidium sp. FACHB-592]
MSNVNIKRVVENIRSKTTIYTPIAEVIVNAIQAVENTNIGQGSIKVVVKRSPQIEIDGSLPSIQSIEVIDEGIGFTDENRDSFDTLYSEYKIREGGKGFGRFTCLKYFKDFHVDSTYFESGRYRRRRFSMGREKEIIVNERVSDSELNTSKTSVTLALVTNSFLDKRLSTVARSLVEKILPYFITKDYFCPEIVLTEEDDSNSIVLNDYLREDFAVIKELEVDENSFFLGQGETTHAFYIRVFKIYSPKNKVSKISLVAHKREVIANPIHDYIPEFFEEFYDKREDGTNNLERNYIIKSYVFSQYLDDNVSPERGEFEFQKDNDIVYGVSQSDIESRAANLTKKAVIDDISIRIEKKQKRILSYVEEEAPWHKNIVGSIDLSDFPYNSSNEEIEALLQKEKFKREVAIRHEVNVILESKNIENFKENISDITEKISESSKNDLIHYISLRRAVLEIFRRSLEINVAGEYSSEGFVHDIIFPRKKGSNTLEYEEHNLWIIDERLNFTSYISSDQPSGRKRTEIPDLLVYDRRVAFRGDNESSNPVTIFEFKKPGRDDFVNPSSKEDPIQQTVRYVNSIRDGKFKTPKGLEINIAINTPFYGYVVCTLTEKVKEWLKRDKNFKPMPDNMGWFLWIDNINLYMEVVSWDKLLKDADMRNKIFFQKLGI